MHTNIPFFMQKISPLALAAWGLLPKPYHIALLEARCKAKIIIFHFKGCLM